MRTAGVDLGNARVRLELRERVEARATKWHRSKASAIRELIKLGFLYEEQKLAENPEWRP